MSKMEARMEWLDNIRHWKAHAILTGERPVWWKRTLIAIFDRKSPVEETVELAEKEVEKRPVKAEFI
jgi:hypothetical protein